MVFRSRPLFVWRGTTTDFVENHSTCDAWRTNWSKWYSIIINSWPYWQYQPQRNAGQADSQKGWAGRFWHTRVLADKHFSTAHALMSQIHLVDTNEIITVSNTLLPRCLTRPRPIIWKIIWRPFILRETPIVILTTLVWHFTQMGLWACLPSIGQILRYAVDCERKRLSVWQGKWVIRPLENSIKTCFREKRRLEIVEETLHAHREEILQSREDREEAREKALREREESLREREEALQQKKIALERAQIIIRVETFDRILQGTCSLTSF